MGKVGAPDMVRVGRYAAMGPLSMPPLSFVSLPSEGAREARTMLVDGHHRITALALLQIEIVPVRILPLALTDDVRIVEMGEVAIFPEFRQPANQVDIGPAL